MNNRIFAYNDSAVRVVGTAGKSLFVAKDICQALGIQNHRDVLAKTIPEDEQGVAAIYTVGGPQEMLVLTEPGMYRLIFRSDKPEAKQFQDWIFTEVLPSIRKTGQYRLDDDKLWTAYQKAKTGKVQLFVLAALGLPIQAATSVGTPNSAAKAVGGIDVARFLDDMLSIFRGGKLTKSALRLKPLSDSKRTLYVSPNELMTSLREYVPGTYKYVERRDLRMALSEGLEEWLPDSRGLRFCGKVIKTWGFAVTDNSPASLVDLCKEISAGGK